MFKKIKNKKGSSFIEALIFTPLIIFVVLMALSRVILLTQTTRNNDISRNVLRRSIACESIYLDENNNNLMDVLALYDDSQVYISSIKIIDPSTNQPFDSVDFPEMTKINLVQEGQIRHLEDYWKRGNILEIDFYFSMFKNLKTDSGPVHFDIDLGFMKLDPIPTGSFINVRGVIENDQVS